MRTTKAKGKLGGVPELSSSSNGSEKADGSGELAVPAVSEEVAAWWSALDAEVRDDGMPASSKEVAAIDAMPSIDVTDSVAKLMSILPPPVREPAQVLQFKRVGNGTHDTADHPVIPAATECFSCGNRDKVRSRHLDVERARELRLERYMAEATCGPFQDAMVGWINFNRGSSLRPLTSALRLAREIAATEHRQEFRCLTLDGRGEDRYSARWSFLVDWLREHQSRSRFTTWKVLNSLHRVLKRDQAHRSWTFRQLRTTVVFTVVGVDVSSGYCEAQVWRSAFVGPIQPSRLYGGYVEAGVPMTVIDGDDVMSVVPHSVDDDVRSAVVAYHGYEHDDSGLSTPSFLPMIRAVLDGESETAHH